MSDPPQGVSRASPARPGGVTSLGCGGLILAAVFLARTALSLSLPALPLTVPPAYLTLTGALWGSVGLLAGLGLLAGRPWAYRGAAVLTPAFVIWYWADRLLLVRTDYASRTWPAAALASLLLLGLVASVLTRPSTRRYFRRPMDDDSEHPQAA